ncbi:FeoA family protein [Salisediminibacterium selenitireducens]|uniref:FeoA family protein n=1 Tax=Bacillus selenitireducens (strain ATCC 700615 / DSM 15326 / MLS10) TaxID=439292 RepID=D6XYQ7_BACIE|nr:FeoA family protein [Salisediminibacterium selenitireducens]ADH98215.1 FeoA family protein [[Bacillus] selenitireducens MLS10]
MTQQGLCQLPCNTSCLIKELPACPLLEGLGISVGSKVCIKQKSPWKGPVVVETKGRREVAIDYAIASQFVVEEVSHHVVSR